MSGFRAAIVLLCMALFMAILPVVHGSGDYVTRPSSTTTIGKVVNTNPLYVTDGRASVSTSLMVGTYVEQDPVLGDYATVGVSSFGSIRQLRQYDTVAYYGSPAWESAPNPTGITGDDSGNWLKLPFPITFWDFTYNYVWVSSNGYVLFPNAVGLKGDYYSGIFGDPNYPAVFKFSRTDAEIAFNWASGGPDPTLTDLFSVRWTGWVRADYNEVYTFATYTDDGVRLWVDGALVIDQWHDQPATSYQTQVSLTQGFHRIQMDYYERYGLATAYLLWNSPSQNGCSSCSPTKISVDNLYLDRFSYWTPAAIPNRDLPNNILAPWWRDLNPARGGSITYGVQSNGDFTISWNGVPDYCDGVPQTFQVQLTQMSRSPGYKNNNIYVLYNSITEPSCAPTVVGVEDEMGARGTSRDINDPHFPVENGMWFLVEDDGQLLSLRSLSITVTEWSDATNDNSAWLDIDVNSRGGLNTEVDNGLPTASDVVISTVSGYAADKLLGVVGGTAGMGAGLVLLALQTGSEYQEKQKLIHDLLNDATTYNDGTAGVKANASPYWGTTVMGVSFTGTWRFADDPLDNKSHCVQIDTTVTYNIGGSSDSSYHPADSVTFCIDAPSSGGGGGGGCVIYDTPILTDHGYVAVQDLKKGDIVMGYDLKQGRLTPIHIVSNKMSWQTSMVSINDGQLILTATDQPVYTEDGGFVGWVRNPGNLKVGQLIFNAVGGRWVPITSLEYLQERARTYDVVTDGPNNFIADGYLLDTK